MSLSALAEILECPKSREDLTVKSGHLHSVSGSHSYRSYMGIPWVFKYPEVHLYQWQSHLKSLLYFYSLQIERLGTELVKIPNLDLTKNRLNQIKNGYFHNLEIFTQILAPLLQDGAVYKPDHQQLILERLPHTQHLQSYSHTLFRDWSWAAEEREEFASLVLDLFLKESSTGEKLNIENLVVLGSGASRLSWDLHSRLQIPLTVCVDINPLLFFCAKKILSSEKIELFEFPLAPLNLENVAVKQSLEFKKKETEINEGFQFLFADALNLPFKKNSLDALLTPWFIDIIPQDFSLLAKRLNASLKQGGVWVNLGPLGYESSLSQSYTQEEILEHLKMAGFEVEILTQKEMVYGSSPYGSQTRIEKVLGFAAKKVSSAKEPPYYHYLPEWILKMDLPIPRTQKVEESQLKYQVAYQLLNLINGQRSQNEIVDLMMNSYGMTREMALETLSTFLIHFFEGKV